MCRYAIHTYKRHYACFACRKAFKRSMLSDSGRQQSVAGRWFAEQAGKSGLPPKEEERAATCPDCGGLMASMGLDFQAPAKTDRKAWQHLHTLRTAGFAFNSCGCGGAGFLSTPEELDSQLAARYARYVQELRFWLNRPVPTTEAEREEDLLRKQRLPMSKCDHIDPAVAVAYWQQELQEIEQQRKQLPLKS